LPASTGGLRQSGAVFEKGWPLKPGIEPELVARISRDAPAGGAPHTADSIRAHVGALYCGMELVDNRYLDVTKMNGPARIADNVLQAALVVGTEIKDWQKLDFANLQGRSTLDGKELAAGPGSAVMGGALISLAWLANADRARQAPQGGRLVLTGSVHPPAFLPERVSPRPNSSVSKHGNHDQIKKQAGHAPIKDRLALSEKEHTVKLPIQEELLGECHDDGQCFPSSAGLRPTGRHSWRRGDFANATRAPRRPWREATIIVLPSP
jgi:hypothetical protein